MMMVEESRSFVCRERRWLEMNLIWFDLIWIKMYMNSCENEMFWSIYHFTLLLEIIYQIEININIVLINVLLTCAGLPHKMKTTCSFFSLIVRMTASVKVSQPYSSHYQEYIMNEIWTSTYPFLVGIRWMCFDSQNRIEEKNTLISPMHQITMRRGLNIEVVLYFLVDISKGRRNCNSFIHRKA